MYIFENDFRENKKQNSTTTHNYNFSSAQIE